MHSTLFLEIFSYDLELPLPLEVPSQAFDVKVNCAVASMNEAGCSVKLSLSLMKNGFIELEENSKQDKYDAVIVGVLSYISFPAG